jgi:hypothetical protein
MKTIKGVFECVVVAVAFAVFGVGLLLKDKQ